MLVQVPLEVVVDVAFQCGWPCITEHADRNLTAVVVQPSALMRIST
jgi:hypothetical protein